MRRYSVLGMLLILPLVVQADDDLSGRSILPTGEKLLLGGSTAAVQQIEQDPRITDLRKQQEECLRTGNHQRFKELEIEIEKLNPPPEQPCELQVVEVPEPPRQDWPGPDVTIYSGREVLSIATDYESDGTMYAAMGWTDSTVRIFKSTDHGENWSYLCGAGVTPRCLFEKIGLVVGFGDSNFIHLMFTHPINNGSVFQLRWWHDGTNVAVYPVWSTQDTIIDFAFCRDNVAPYFLYAWVNEELNVSKQNLWSLRSTTFGRTWAVNDSLYNGSQPHLTAGAGSWIYAAVVPTVYKGYVFALWNRLYGAKGQWSEENFRPDTFPVNEPKIAPVFTEPDSEAATYLVYRHWSPVSGSDVLGMFSPYRCINWSGPRLVSSSLDSEYFIDLKNYRSVGNPYVNVSYIHYDVANNRRTLYWAWSHPMWIGKWFGTSRVAIAQPLRSPTAAPSLVYSPGVPIGGGGVVFGDYNSPSLLFNAPWRRQAGISADSIYFKNFYSTTQLYGAPKSQIPNPIPGPCRSMTFMHQQSAVCMDPNGDFIFEIWEDTLRRHQTRDGSFTNFLLGRQHQAVATDGSFLYAFRSDTVVRYTTIGALCDLTVIDMQPFRWNFSVARDTLWCGRDSLLYGYACTRLTGGSIIHDAVWNVGAGTGSPAKIAWDGQYFYVAWSGLVGNTFKQFDANRTLIATGVDSVDARGIMCFVGPASGVQEPVLALTRPEIRILPNPLTGYAVIQSSTPLSGITIYDLAGREIRRVSAPLGREYLWNRTDDRGRQVAPGVYFIRLDAAAGVVTRKVVVE